MNPYDDLAEKMAEYENEKWKKREGKVLKKREEGEMEKTDDEKMLDFFIDLRYKISCAITAIEPYADEETPSITSAYKGLLEVHKLLEEKIRERRIMVNGK